MIQPALEIGLLYAFFPRAAWYAQRGVPGAERVCEDGFGWVYPPPAERHLQCVWFDPALRPPELHTSDGETVVVDDPGVWNVEAGPDFLGAVLRVGPEQRRFSGDVEIHLQARDWTSHHHAADPRYARVRVHVTYHPAGLPAGRLPPGTLQVPLRDALGSNPRFSFEDIDLTLYPYGRRAATPPCSDLLAGWKPDERIALLEAAGEERLRRKAERLAAAIREVGADQAVYEELMSALGYKHNKSPFRQLAQRVPLAALRDHARGDAGRAYALLVGAAGLLPSRAEPDWDPPTREFLRRLWDTWWKCESRWAAGKLDASAWCTGGARPTNHPARRLMAAACWFTQDPPVAARWQALAAAHPEDCARLVEDALLTPLGTYWDRRLALAGPLQPRPVSLIGRTRARAVVNNVLIPFLAARGLSAPFGAGLPGRMPLEEENLLVRRTACSLFGPDYAPSLIRSGLRQQGLLQIFHDFCLNDRSRCAGCALPELLRRHLADPGEEEGP